MKAITKLRVIFTIYTLVAIVIDLTATARNIWNTYLHTSQIQRNERERDWVKKRNETWTKIKKTARKRKLLCFDCEMVNCASMIFIRTFVCLTNWLTDWLNSCWLKRPAWEKFNPHLKTLNDRLTVAIDCNRFQTTISSIQTYSHF